MKQISIFILSVLFLTACSITPAAKVTPALSGNAAPTAIQLGNAAPTEAGGGNVNAPTQIANVVETVTPPPAPNQIATEPALPQPTKLLATAPLPTLSNILSPSVTPMPQLPTRRPTLGPTVPPSRTPVVISRETLRGKILFKSTRNGGRFPNNPQWFVMNGDGSQVQQVPGEAAKKLYLELKGREGFSPDTSMLVLGEAACASNAHCDLYVGAPETIANRSQGQWTPTGQRWYRADNPAWSPQGNWIAFIWNRDNDRTKNIFKGDPFVLNQDFKRLTDFGGRRDTKELSYSPDGTMLAFATQDGPHWQIWTLNAMADNPNDAAAHNITNTDADEWDPLWIK